MNKLIAHCGLDCEKCEARIATLNNDDALREKVARLWSEWNHANITKEMINCDGCRVNGRKTPFCDKLCPIKQCVISKGYESCGDCQELETCQTVKMITGNNPDALCRLQNSKSLIIDDEVISIVKMDESMYYDVWQNSLDENNRKYVPDEVFETLEDATEVVDYLIESYNSKDGPFVYAVIRNEDSKNLGYVQLVKIEEGWEIGYHIAKQYCGNGYATRAASLFLKYLKYNSDIKRIYGVALFMNKASRRVLEKNGFELIFEGYGKYQGKRRKIIKTIKEIA